MMDIFCVLSQATGVTEQALREAVLRSASHNDGADLSRVQRVLRKAACGEAITVAGLGGSITQGVAAKSYGNGRGNNAREFSDALGGEKCWLDRTADSLRLRYPASQVTSVNAGIGATPSFLGTFLMDRMVLKHKPDLVFVEFSVNYPSTHAFLLENEIFDAYESIVRKLLEADVAVVLVFLNDRDNNGLQRIHSKIAHHYGVPAVNYHDAVYPEGKLICDWIKLSPDEIHPNNVKRVVRALEIAMTTGNTKSRADELSREGENPFAPTIIRLTYADRGKLYEKINLRVRRMFEEGLEEEVRTLCEKGLRETPTASQAIGYKEFYPYFDGEISIEQVEEDICRNTRRYAKRQETWFSRMQHHQLITL